jgi:hypothetical protein
MKVEDFRGKSDVLGRPRNLGQGSGDSSSNRSLVYC